MLGNLIQILSLRSVCSGQILQKPTLLARRGLCAALGITVLGILASGCGSVSTSGVKAGAISVTNASGAASQLTSLAAGGTAQLSMMPVGDKANAGVDWAVTCGGNPVTGSITNGACGTLTSAHTADGVATLYTAPSVVPIGTTITITATVTSSPSQVSSVSLTIVSLPIAVSFTGFPPPSSMAVNTVEDAAVVVANDPANAGVLWTATCGSSACGSFNPTITQSQSSTIYAAPTAVPAGGTVTITATSITDTTKSVSAMITITPAGTGAPTLSVSPTSFYAETTGATHSTSLIATVVNDSTNGGVNWLMSCSSSNCGTLTTKHTASGVAVTYDSPSAVPTGGTVTITATSVANPTVSASSIATIITTTPIVVTMSTAPPATLEVGSQTTLAATVANDSSNSGVNWTASCSSAGACGSFSATHTASTGQTTYTAPSAIPSGSIVTITASSAASTPSNPAMATTTITSPPVLSFSQAPPATMQGTTQAAVSATVTNDVAPGGVTWTLKCNSSAVGGCGGIVPYQTASGGIATYTAPPVKAAGTSVTIVATSTGDPSVSISSTPGVITPATTLAVTFVPLAPSQVEADVTVNLAAAVTNDATNAGVDWQVCASGCGFFTTQPAIPEVLATATTPDIPAVPAVTATSVSAWPNNRPLAYTSPSQAPSSGSVVMVIAAHANAAAANSATIAIAGVGSTGPALHGVVQAGLQPVVGASVALYAAGISGYGSASTQVPTPGGAATFATDSNGNFNVPVGYSCPQPNSQMYLVATGGHVGAQTANPNLALMTVLGTCSSLSSSSVVVNEVTSIASAFATAPFAANDALSGNSSYLYIGASSSNSTGLANAFAAVNNLVNISTGQARFTIPAGNAAVPYVEINTLAGVLNACTATSGGVEGDGGACGTLFTETDVLPNHALYNSIAPRDTLQAAYNIAQHPVSNYGYLLDTSQDMLGLATLASPFQPILTAQPNDWSMSLNYTGGGGLSAASSIGSFAVDAAGDLWITDKAAGSVIEWNGVGAALSPSTGFTAGGGPIAIDATGNVWVSGNGSLSELTSLGTPLPGSPFGGVAGGGEDIAIDQQSNLWITNPGGVNEFNSLGTEISPSAGYTNSAVTGVTAVAIDSSNNVWVANRGDSTTGPFTLAELTNPGGQLVVSAEGRQASTPSLPEIVADGAGDLWTVLGGDGLICEVPPYGGKGTNLLQTCYSDGGNGSFQDFNPEGIAIDGAGTVWVASPGGGSGPVIPPSVLPIAPGLLAGSNSPNNFANSSLAAGPLRVAIDSSGNVWVLLANNTVTEYVGAATPVVTPLALAVKDKKLAAKP
jgi:hypothetical protein